MIPKSNLKSATCIAQHVVCILTTIFLIFISFTSFCQDFKADWKKIVEAYKQHDKFSMHLEYRLYKNYSSTEVFENGSADVKKSGDVFHYTMLGTETLVNDKYVIILNHNLKKLMIDRHMPRKTAPMIKVDLNMDSILQAFARHFGDMTEQHEQVECREQDNQLQEYTLNYGIGEYKAIKIVFNKNTWHLEKMVLLFRNEYDMAQDGHKAAPRLEILYQDFNSKPEFSADEFSEQQFLTVLKDGNLNVKSKYKGYSVINHLLSDFEDYVRQ